MAELETLRAAYELAKRNDGAPGSDGVTFDAIEAAGVEAFLAQLRDELVARTYRPLRYRRVEIAKGDGKDVRILGVPAFGTGWCRGRSNSSWSRSSRRTFTTGRTATVRAEARAAVARVTKAIVKGKTRAIDLDLAADFDSVRHDLLFAKVARRIRDAENPAT